MTSLPPATPQPARAAAPAAAARDDSLALAAQAGDRLAFAALVQRHQSGLFAFLGRMGLRQAEAEEVAQDSFLRAWQHLPQWQAERGAFSTWLYTLARRLALHTLDRAQRRTQDLCAEPPDIAADSQCGPPQQLHLRQQQARLQAALRGLPTDDRSALALAYVQGFSLADVARIEGCSEPAVKARLHRARQRLRTALSDLDPGPWI